MANIDIPWEVDGMMTPEQSVSAMFPVIQSKKIQHSGTFWTWENKVCNLLLALTKCLHMLTLWVALSLVELSTVRVGLCGYGTQPWILLIIVWTIKNHTSLSQIRNLLIFDISQPWYSGYMLILDHSRATEFARNTSHDVFLWGVLR